MTQVEEWREEGRSSGEEKATGHTGVYCLIAIKEVSN